MKKLSNLFKLILTLVICLAMGSFTDFQIAYANDNSLLGNQTDSAYDYFASFYSGEKDILVTNQNEQDVTNSFLSRTADLFYENDIESIKKLMAKEGLRTHIFTEVIMPMQLFGLEQYKSVYDDMADYYEEPNHHTVMEFRCRLIGGIWYDSNTFQVTRVSNPTFQIVSMGTPMGIEPSCNDIQTGSNVISGKGYFWARFTLSGAYYDEKGACWFRDYYYGTHTISFYATP